MLPVLSYSVLGMPMAFLASVVAVVLLTIFFGAWAVSAESSNSRAYSLAASANGSVIGPPSDTSLVSEGVSEGAEETAADSWWGGALLKACPLH